MKKFILPFCLFISINCFSQQWDNFIVLGLSGTSFYNSRLTSVIDSFNSDPGVFQQLPSMTGMKGFGFRFGAYPDNEYDVGLFYQWAESSGSRNNDSAETLLYDVFYHVLNLNYSYGFPVVEENNFQILPGGAINAAMDLTSVKEYYHGLLSIDNTIETVNFDFGLEAHVEFVGVIGGFMAMLRPYAGFYIGGFNYTDLYGAITDNTDVPETGIHLAPKIGIEFCLGMAY